MSQPPEDTLQAEKRALLQSLAAALTTVSNRLRALEATKRMIFLLAARAETIADQSLRLTVARANEVPEASSDLIAQIQAFAGDFTELSERVAVDISAEQNLAETLAAHAGQLLLMVGAMDQGSGSDRMVRLRPLAESLAGLAGRRTSDKSVAEETRALAARSADLAEQAAGMAPAGGGADVRRVGADLYHGLRAIADDAAVVSQRIEAEAALLNAAMAAMATGAERMAGGTLRPAANGAGARIQQMVRKGKAAMDWAGGEPAPTRS